MARYRRVQTIAHDIGPEGQLVLAVTSADVRLTAAEGSRAELQATFEVRARDEAQADAYFEEAKLQVAAEAGRLEAVEFGSEGGLGAAVGRMLGGHDVNLVRVEGSAPPGCRLEVRAVSGDLQASGFSGNQRYDTVSGDLRVVEAAGELETHSVSGDVSLRAVGDVQLNVSTVSGDLAAVAPTILRLEVNAVSGDVSVDGSLGAGPHTIDTVSGDVRLATNSGLAVSVRGLASDVHSSLPHRLEGTADRRRMIVGDSSAELVFSSMSGDLAVTGSRNAPKGTAAATSPTTATNDSQADVLAALERGEINVDEAMRRLGGN
jgi:hypothetical protein